MREFWLISSSLLMALVCGGCAWGFWRLKNLLLAGEWTVLTVSTLTVLVAAFGQWPPAFAVWHFFDVFSRLLGFPLIVGIGLLKVLRGWEPGKTADALLFGGCVALGAWLSVHRAWDAGIEWAAAAAFVVFLGVLIWFARQCFAHGLRAHGSAVLAIIASNIALGVLQLDYLSLAPGDHMPLHLDEFLVTYVVWTIGFGETYFAYAALARAKGLLPATA